MINKIYEIDTIQQAIERSFPFEHTAEKEEYYEMVDTYERIIEKKLEEFKEELWDMLNKKEGDHNYAE